MKIRTPLHDHHYKIGVLGKGGVGETTVAACVGSIFAHVRLEERVVAIDADTAFGQLGSRIDPETPGSYWDLAADQHLDTFADLRTQVGKSGHRPRPRRRKYLDFGLITQPWLRELTLAWAREERQSYVVVKTHRAAVVASQALESRSDRGRDMTELGDRDVDAIAEGIRVLTRVDNGEPCKTSFKRHIFAVFFDLITWGRRHGLLDGLPPSFEPTRTRIHLPADPVVEEAGKAIPEAVQRQLDTQTDSLGIGFTHGILTPEQTHQMFLTAYIVLRDTGRRTLEVASLRTDCVSRDAAGPVLIYDNHKARRLGRRLPILESTAKTIVGWAEIRKTISTSSQEYLFPGTTIAERHLSSNGLSAAILKWARGLETLNSHEVGANGDPVPFDRSNVHPLRIPPLVRTTARRQRNTGRRSAPAHGPSIDSNHRWLLHDHCRPETHCDRKRWLYCHECG